jgi:23S rRNA pseudouridine1911/1915/1917 synthase
MTSILRSQFPQTNLHLVHRLDRETSGVLIFAKCRDSARKLTGQFFRREIFKEYLAITIGRFACKTTTVEIPLGREGLDIKVRQKAGGEEGARTVFECMAANAQASLVRALPKTGRLHQIRVHLALLGHPILGDKLYTGDGHLYMKAVKKELTPEDLKGLGASRQMLHARALTLQHPATGQKLKIVAKPPHDFLECLKKLGLKLEA